MFGLRQKSVESIHPYQYYMIMKISVRSVFLKASSRGDRKGIDIPI